MPTRRRYGRRRGDRLHTTDFTQAVKEFDAVLEVIGGDNPAKALVVLKPGSILVSTLPPTGAPLEKAAAARHPGRRAVGRCDRLGMTDPNCPTALPPAIATPISHRWAELYAAAVNALTEAVRHEPGGEPIDFGEFLASVLETVAANVGSVARLVVGRSSSDEAAWIHRLASGESATLEWLAPGRTEPVVEAAARVQLTEDSPTDGPTED